MKAGRLRINNLAGLNPSLEPFNTSSVDLRLAPEIYIPKRLEKPWDLRVDYPGNYLLENSEHVIITKEKPFVLEPYVFVLGWTLEHVSFPMDDNGLCYSARVEGKSSRARVGLIVHLTAPTIHNEFDGKIALEIVNLGLTPILLHAGIFICQLVIEQLDREAVTAPNQFSGQVNPVGTKR
jgi:dCTP deaminase